MKILYFSAIWCGPCKAMKPIIEKFQEEHSDVEIIKIDADDEFELAMKHEIRAVPTFILFDADGNELKRKQGGFTAPALYNFVYGE